MTYQDPDPLRDSDLDRDARIDRNYGSNAMWGWIAGAVVLVLDAGIPFRRRPQR